MTNNALEQLEASGISLSSATQEQKDVLAHLSEAEIGVLTSVKSRLDATGSDVEAHLDEDRGGIFW